MKSEGEDGGEKWGGRRSRREEGKGEAWGREDAKGVVIHYFGKKRNQRKLDEKFICPSCVAELQN